MATKGFAQVWAAAGAVSMLLLGCKSEEAPLPEAQAAPAETKRDTPRPQSEPEPPRTVVVSAALAAFRSNRLDECVDYAVELPADASDSEKAEISARLTGQSGESDGVKSIVLRKSCSEQFHDREAVATCVISGGEAPFRNGTVRAVAASTYYQAETARKNDVFMSQCLEMGGDWKEYGPAPRPSPIPQRKSRLLQKLEAEGQL